MASAAEQLASNMSLGVFSKATELKQRLWLQVEPILKAIEANLAISTPATTPDLGDAQSVREMEEDFHQS